MQRYPGFNYVPSLDNLGLGVKPLEIAIVGRPEILEIHPVMHIIDTVFLGFIIAFVNKDLKRILLICIDRSIRQLIIPNFGKEIKGAVVP